eukprot:3937208-Rhodomonas_salina.7
MCFPWQLVRAGHRIAIARCAILISRRNKKAYRGQCRSCRRKLRNRPSVSGSVPERQQSR